MQKNLTVFLDMDGVQVDLITGMSQVLCIERGILDEANFSEKFWDYFPQAVDGDVFLKAPPTKFFSALKSYARILVAEGIDVQILTSVTEGRNKVDTDKIKRDKTVWLGTHLRLDLKTNFSHGGKAKANYIQAHPTLLIDDTDKVIKNFEKNGGLVFHLCQERHTEERVYELVEHIDRLAGLKAN